MGNEKILDKICNNYEILIDGYEDLTLTKQAHDAFIKCLDAHGMEDAEHIFEVESALYGLEFARERQGFIYGFNLALEILQK